VSDQLHDATDAIEIVDRLLRGREDAEGGEPRRLRSLLDRDLAPDAAEST
jgi:hypothetical protein